MAITGATDLGNGVLAVTVDHDPQAVATDVPAGSLIITATGDHHRKLDDGSTTNVTAPVTLKDNLSATTDPTTSNDNTEDYEIGSRWINTATGRVYMCVDASTGAAVWNQLTLFEHKDTHKSGGTDAFVATDLLEALVKRIRESGGADLTVGAVADGELLTRSGSSLVGSALSATHPVIDTAELVEGSADPTKRMRIEVDGLTTATLRTLSMPDKDITPDDQADPRDPNAHASDHTDGADDIQDATAAQKGLATATQITKLDGIETGAEVNDVDSVFGRTGAVVAALSDYDASQVDNDSGVAGATVKDALDALDVATADATEDVLTWVLSGDVISGSRLDAARAVRRAGTIVGVIVTAGQRGNNGTSLFDINKHVPTKPITTQRNATPGVTVYTTQANRPDLDGNSPTSTDDAVKEAVLPDVTSFAAGDAFSLDVDVAINQLQNVVVQMFVVYG